MKKFISAFIVAAIILLGCTSCLSAGGQDYFLKLQIDNPVMTLNDKAYEIDPGRGTAPLIKDGRTLVPIRAIIENIGGQVLWDDANKKITLTYKNDEIVLQIDSNKAYINGNFKTLDVAPAIINDRTMMPIRFIAEGFNFSVAWDEKSATVYVSVYERRSHALVAHFIDVGQGDSVFIELPYGETVLIDGGPDEDTTTEYIENLGYEKITYVIATHPDADHITGLPKLLKTFQVDKFYMPEKEHTTKIFEKMLDAVLENGCEAIYAAAGKSIVNEAGLSLDFVAPVKTYSDNNDCSAVVKLTYMENSFLFTGDAEKKAEEDIINAGYDITADVLKVGHHGSKTSTSQEFLEKVNPKTAIISVGEDNRYNHPSDEVIHLLNSKNIKIYRTDQSGTIVFLCDGEGYDVKWGAVK